MAAYVPCMSWLVCLCLLLGAACADRSDDVERAASPAGLRVRLTRHALDYASALGEKLVQQELSAARLPALSAKIDDGPGHGQIYVKNIKLAHVDVPKFNYELAEPDTFTWKADDGAVVIQGDWSAWYTVIFKVWASGSLDIVAHDIAVSIGGYVNRTETGLPQVKLTHCESGLGRIDVTFHGGFVPWILNLFSGPISNTIKSLLHSKLCSAVRGVAIDYANEKLRTLPQNVSLGDHFYLNYAMASDPIVEANYVQSDFFAEVTYGGERTPLVPKPLPPPEGADNTTHMLVVWATDFVINTFFYSAHEHGRLNFALTKDTSASMGPYLSTECFLMCIGAVIPQLAETHPDSYIDVLMYTNEAPIATATEKDARIFMNLTADLYLHPWNATNKLLVRTEVELDNRLELVMRQSSLTGSMQAATFHIKLVESMIGRIEPEAFNFLQGLAKPYLEDSVNAYLHQGVPMPVVQGVRALRSHLHLMDDAVEIETDVVYGDWFKFRLMQ